MYLRIESWSIPYLLGQLESKGLPCGEHIFEVDDSPFREDEVFSYEGRETYTGVQHNKPCS